MIVNLEVDAQENPLANTVAYGVDKVHPHVTMTAHLYGTRGLFANRRIFEKLPDELRTIVLDAISRAVSTQRRAAADYEDELRKRLEDRGLSFVDLSPDQKSEFIRGAGPAIALAHRRLPEELFELAGA